MLVKTKAISKIEKLGKLYRVAIAGLELLQPERNQTVRKSHRVETYCLRSLDHFNEWRNSRCLNVGASAGNTIRILFNPDHSHTELLGKRVAFGSGKPVRGFAKTRR